MTSNVFGTRTRQLPWWYQSIRVYQEASVFNGPFFLCRDTDTCWVMRAYPIRHTLRVTFSHLDLKASGNCSDGDYLEIRAGIQHICVFKDFALGWIKKKSHGVSWDGCYRSPTLCLPLAHIKKGVMPAIKRTLQQINQYVANISASVTGPWQM